MLPSCCPFRVIRRRFGAGTVRWASEIMESAP